MASIPPPPPPPPLPGDFSSIPPPPAAPTTAAVATPPETAAVTQPQQPAASVDESKQWDRPWSTSVVRQNAKQWSLAGDTALLLYLKEMSANMISRTHDLATEIDNLSASIKTCEVSTNNAFNEFITLANNQFVENRVYDEDVSHSAAGDGNTTEESKKEKSKEEVEGELIPKISEAVKLGLNVLDTAYERLEVNIDDADDDDDEPYQGEPMLEIKDPYILRSLPVLIGSEAFHQNDNVGLIDMPSEDEESDHGSISESEEEDVGPAAAAESSEYSYSDSEEETNQTSSRQPIAAAAKLSSDSSSESDDDMFGTSSKPAKQTILSSTESESEAETTAVPSTAAPVDFASELAKKIGVPASQVVVAEDEKPRKKKAETKAAAASSNKQSGKSKKTKKKTKDDDDLFGAAESDDDGGLFSSRGGLFDSGGGLFDNSTGQDDGGLFDDVDDVDVSQLKSQKEPAQASSSEEDSEPEEAVATKAQPAKAKQPPVKKAAAASHDLFGADSDEDDLFASSKPKAALISDSDDEDELLKSQKDKSRARTASGRKVPAGAISMFGGTGGGNPLAAALSKRRKSSSEDDDWASGKSRENSISKPSVQPSKSTKTKTGLFSSTDSEGEDDDLFSEPKASQKASPQSTKKKMPAGAVSMFGSGGNPLAAALKSRAESILSAGDGSSEDEKPQKSAAPAGSSGLLDGDDEEDGLFGPKDTADTSRSVKKPAGGVSLFGGADLFGKGQAASKSDSLFKNDDESEDIPPPTKATPKKSEPVRQLTSSKPSKGLFSDSDDDNDLFASKISAKPAAAVKSTSKGLFSDSDSGEDAPPTSAPQKTSAQPAFSQKSKPALFGDSDDNDDMFGSSTKAAPAKSASTKSTLVESAPEAAVTKQAAKAPTTSKDLFADSDEDDMFGSAPKKSATAAKSESAKPAAKPAAKTADRIAAKTAAKTAANKSLFNESDEEEPSLAAAATNPASTVSKPAAGMFDDSDNDDLFSGKRKITNKSNNSGSSKVKPTSIESKPVSDSPLGVDVVAATKTSSKPAAALFENVSDDDDMFGVSKPAAKVAVSSAGSDADSNREEETKPVEQVKPKRPAGAVSMFGGMDPTSLLKKKSPATNAVDKPAAKPSRKSVPTSSLFDSDSDEDLFSSKHTRKPYHRRVSRESERLKSDPPKETSPAKDTEPPKDTSPVKDTEPPKDTNSSDPLQLPSSVTVKKPIAKKIANIGINPLAMMPGAAPPKKEAAPQAVGFDIPAENTNVLHSLNKSRAKVQQKRKPPSRHNRGKASSASASSASALPSEVSGTLEDRVPAIDSPAVNGNNDVHFLGQEKQKVTSQDPFLDDSDDDFYSPKSVTKLPPADPISPAGGINSGFGQPDTSIKNIDQSDVSAKNIKSNPPAPPAADPMADYSDEADFFSKTNSASATGKEENVATTTNGQSATQDTHSNVRSPSPLHEEPPPLDDYSSPDTAPSKSGDAFTLADSDDDIFSVKPAKTSKQKTVADIFDDDDLFTSKKPAKKKPVLDDLDDDLFASKPVKTKRQKAFTKDEDLFGDDDIFADISTKNKEKKSRAGSAVKKSQPAKKSAIDDDMDDLFADLGTKKSKSKTLDLDDDDLFGDPLGGLK